MKRITDLFRSPWSLRRLSSARRAVSGPARRGPPRSRARLTLDALEDRTVPSTLTVTTPDDLILNDGKLSLREAILVANFPGTIVDGVTSNDVADTIVFDNSLFDGTISLNGTQLPVITSELTITGLGADHLAIDAHHASGIFVIDSGVTVQINDLTLTQGSVGVSSGGAIYNLGTLTVAGSTLSGNSAFNGGAIYNDFGVELTLTDSTLSDNSAINGGAIFNFGTLAVTGSTLSGNSAVASGAILNFGTLAVTGSTLSDNSATWVAGAIRNDGELTVTDSTLSGNSAPDGGAIDNTGMLTVTDTTLSDNVAVYTGGAIISTGQLTVTASILSGNSTSDPTFDLFGGGAIYNSGGTLTVADCILSDNSAEASGGAIHNYFGTLTVTGSTLSGNTAGIGGAIYNNFGTLTATGSTLSGNSAVYGGGIFNDSHITLTVAGSTLTGNSAYYGGAIYNAGTAEVMGSTLSGNSGGLGGAIFNGYYAALTVADSTLSGNLAGFGGAIFNGFYATLTVADSTLSGNSADFEGGAIYNANYATLTVADSTLSGNSALLYYGGAISNYATLTVSGSTLSGNSAHSGGAIFNYYATLTVSGSTLSGNSARDRGGAIFNYYATLTVSGSTIVLNRADADGNDTGTGGGINNYNVYASATLDNTIVAGNLRGIGTTADDIAGAIDAAGSHNLIGDAGSAGGLVDGVNGNIVGNDGVGVIDIHTVLDTTLADNGGPTFTHALVTGSPAINAGDNSLIPPGTDFDQRGEGFARIVGGTVDIGAFEVQNQAPVVNDFTRVGAEDNALAFTAADFTAHYSDPDGDALVSVRIESLPANGTLKLDGVAVAAGQEIAAADLGKLVFVPNLNFNGTTTFTYTASDGISGFALTPATVTLHIQSADEQAVAIAAEIEALYDAGVINEGQAEALTFYLRDNNGDAGKVGAFLNQVNAFVLGGILTDGQAGVLLDLGNMLLISLTTR